MVEVLHATITDPTVLRTKWSQAPTSMAESGKYVVPFFPLIEVRDLFDCREIAVRVKRHISRIPTIRNYPTDPHNQIPIYETVMGTAD